MGGVGEDNIDRQLGAVACRLQADHLIPAGVVGTSRDRLPKISRAIGVHRAVEIDGWRAPAVRGKDPLHIGSVGHIGAALVVQDDVVALSQSSLE